MLLLVSEHNLFVRCFLFLPQSTFNQICQTFKLESWQEFLPVYSQWKHFWRHVLEPLLILAGLLSTARINHLQLLVGVVSLSNGWVFFIFEYVLNESSRCFRPSLWFHNGGCLTARGRLRRKIVLVPSAGSPKEPDQRLLLPDLLLQLRVEGCPRKVRGQGSSCRRKAKCPTVRTLVLDHFRHLPHHFLLWLSASEDIGWNISTNKSRQGLSRSKVVQLDGKHLKWGIFWSLGTSKHLGIPQNTSK